MIGTRATHWLLGAALTAGCGGSAVPAQTAELSLVAKSPEAAPWTTDATSQASRAGAGAPFTVAVEAAAPGDRVGGVLEVPSEQCLLLVARSAPSVDDLDLFVYAEDGTVLATDETPAKDATALVCPPLPRHVYVTGRVASGHGIVAVVAQPVDVEHAPAVAKALHVRGTDAEPLDPWDALDEAVARHRRDLGGSWRGLRKLVLPADPRIPTRVSADIADGGCLDVLAVPSEDVAHVQLTAVDERGQIVARAPSTGKARSLLLCSPIATRITLELRPHAGRGGVALVLSVASLGDAGVAEVPHIDLMPTAPLSDRLDRTAEKLSRRGYGPARLAAKGSLRVGVRETKQLRLSSGCSRIDVTVGQPALGVEAWLWDPEGALVANAGGGGAATLFACVPAKPLRLDIEAITRAGPYLAEVRKLPASLGTLTHLPLAAGRLLRALDDLDLLDSAKVLAPPARVTLSPDRVQRLDFTVPVGRCVTTVAAVDRGGTGVEIRLLGSADGPELASAHGTHATSARICALDVPDTLHATAEIRLAAGTAEGFVSIRQTSPGAGIVPLESSEGPASR
jgi:hypothetical protein